jgi:hypothetical protein
MSKYRGQNELIRINKGDKVNKTFIPFVFFTLPLPYI